MYFFELYECCAYSANPKGRRSSDTQHEYTEHQLQCRQQL